MVDNYSTIKHTKVILLILTPILLTFSCGETKEELSPNQVMIEANEVFSIDIDSHISKFQLVSDGEDWFVNQDNGVFPAERESVHQLIETLNLIKFTNLIGDKVDTRKQYLVDSTGARVTVKTKGQTVLDIIIGQLGMHSAQRFHTYVRNVTENEIYAAPQFNGAAISRIPENYRNQILARINQKTLGGISFEYIDDGTSFELTKSNSEWLIKDIAISSDKMTTYLEQVKVLIGVDFFVGNVKHLTHLGSITFQYPDRGNIVVHAYEQADHSWVFQSSENEKNFFTDEKFKELFKIRKDFI